MATLATKELTQSIVDLLTEAYAGPSNPSGTWFIDNEPDCGILGILSRVTAAEASRSVHETGDRGSTIAANAEHLRWSLANANGAVRGDPYNGNWSESWDLLEADEAKWDRLRQELRREYELLLQAILEQENLMGEELKGVIALVPHAAYHLGTIRQMIERIRA